MKVESFVNECVNTLDTFEEFDFTNNPALPCRNVTDRQYWTNEAGVEDSIVDRVIRSDDPFGELVEIIRHTLEEYDVEPTDEQIAAEIVNLRFTYIKGIVTEMNYTSYKKKCEDVKEVLNAGEIAKEDDCTVEHVEQTRKVDTRVVYTDGTFEDVQIKSSSSSRNRHVNKHMDENKGADVAVYPRDTGGWDRRTE